MTFLSNWKWNALRGHNCCLHGSVGVSLEMFHTLSWHSIGGGSIYFCPTVEADCSSQMSLLVYLTLFIEVSSVLPWWEHFRIYASSLKSHPPLGRWHSIGVHISRCHYSSTLQALAVGVSSVVRWSKLAAAFSREYLNWSSFHHCDVWCSVSDWKLWNQMNLIKQQYSLRSLQMCQGTSSLFFLLMIVWW